MKKLLNDVAAFQRAYEAPCHPSRDAARTSGDLTPERVKLRLRLVFEETLELLRAHGMDTATIEPQFEASMSLANGGEGPYLEDVTEIADALGDSIYVEVGMALEYGIPLDHVWQEIQDSNMKKFPGGKVIRRESDGKVLKPEGWKPPDIETVIQRVTDAEWHAPLEPEKVTLRDQVNARADAVHAGMVAQGLADPSGALSSADMTVLRMDALLDILTEREQ